MANNKKSPEKEVKEVKTGEAILQSLSLHTIPSRVFQWDHNTQKDNRMLPRRQLLHLPVNGISP